MKIRKATLKDIPQIVAIARIPELPYIQKATEKEARAYFKEFLKKGIILVAEEEKKIQGFITGEYTLGGFIWLDVLAVKKNLRGKGVGKKLFKAFRAHVKKKKAKYIYLIAPKFNKKTIKFYEKLKLKKGKEYVEFTKDL